MTEQTYYRWRKEYGGLQVGQAKRLKEKGKPHKLVLIAVARKLIIIANAMLARNTKWKPA